jgi:outer membrane protein TolC
MIRRMPAVLLIILIAFAAPRGAFAQSTASTKNKADNEANRIEELIRQAAEQFAAADQGAASPPAQPGQPYPLRLDDAVKFALAHNLDIAVERLNPQTFDFSIAALDANYRPTWNSGFNNGNRVTLPTSQLTTSQPTLETGTVNWNSAISQNLKWGGGSVAFGFNNQRTDSSNEFVTRNPSYTSSVNFALVQPLLRGFKTDNTRAQLQITRINQEVSEVQLKGTITNILSNVRNAYWDFLFTTQGVDVARQSLALAEKLVEDNKTRVEIGTMAPIDVVQAEAEAATRRQALTQAEGAMRTAELALKRLIVSGTEDPLWRASLVPTDRPDLTSASIDIEGALRKALETRTDLQQARRQLESNDITLQQFTNQMLPALDLVTTYGLSGLGGTQYARSNLGGNILRVVPGGYSSALANIRRLDAPIWNVSLNLSYPIGTSPAEANFARARLQQTQTQAQVRQLELEVATEVTNAALNVQNAQKRVESASAARDLQAQRVEAEQSKFEVGISTNFQVVQAQRDLRDAQNIELRALLDYQKSLVDFERAQETSLSRAGITVITGGGAGATTAGAANRVGGGGGGGFGGGGQ